MLVDVSRECVTIVYWLVLRSDSHKFPSISQAFISLVYVFPKLFKFGESAVSKKYLIKSPDQCLVCVGTVGNAVPRTQFPYIFCRRNVVPMLLIVPFYVAVNYLSICPQINALAVFVSHFSFVLLRCIRFH